MWSLLFCWIFFFGLSSGFLPPLYFPLELKQWNPVAQNNSRFVTPGFVYEFPTIKVSIGTPAVTFNVSVETGGEELFVFDVQYPDARPFQPLYDRMKSHSSQRISKSFFAQSGWSVASGHTVRDAVTVESCCQRADFVQHFGSALGISEFPYDAEFPVDGVLGLRWHRLTKKREQGPAAFPIHSLLAGRQKIYQIYAGGPKGGVLFGAATLPQCSSGGVRIPMAPKSFLPKVLVDSFHTAVNKYDEPKEALFDTGFGIVRLPRKVFSLIEKELHPEFIFMYHQYFVKCDLKFSDWTFTLAGMEYKLSKADIVSEIPFEAEKDRGLCILKVAPHNIEDSYIFGMPFHRKLCVTFDLANDYVELNKPR